jgi:hypothetical protein
VPKETVSITLKDGKPRHLRYDYNALCALEEEYGMAFDNLKELQDIIAKPGRNLRTFRFLLWAGLSHEDSALTVQQVGALIDLDRTGEIGQKLVEAIVIGLNVEPGEVKNSEAPDQGKQTESPGAGATT